MLLVFLKVLGPTLSIKLNKNTNYNIKRVEFIICGSLDSDVGGV